MRDGVRVGSRPPKIRDSAPSVIKVSVRANRADQTHAVTRRKLDDAMRIPTRVDSVALSSCCVANQVHQVLHAGRSTCACACAWVPVHGYLHLCIHTCR